MAPLPSGGYNTATQCAESEMQAVGEAVTISMRLGYTLAPLGAHPTLKLTIPSSLGSLHLELRSVFLHGYFGFQGGTGLKPLCGSLDSGCPTFTSQNETDYNVV